MRRRFCDLYSLPIEDSLNDFREKCSLLRELRYHGLTVVARFDQMPSREELERLKDKFSRMKECAEEIGVDLISRAELRPRSLAQARRMLRSIRGNFELVSMPAYDRGTTAFACRDGRIDIVTIVPVRRFALFKGDATYLKSRDKAIELLLSFLRRQSNLDRLAYLLGLYKRVIGIARQRELKLVFSLGILDPREAPDPLSLCSLLLMLGLPREESLNAVSLNAFSLVKVNRHKLLGRMPVRGVEVVDGKSPP